MLRLSISATVRAMGHNGVYFACYIVVAVFKKRREILPSHKIVEEGSLRLLPML